MSHCGLGVAAALFGIGITLAAGPVEAPQRFTARQRGFWSFQPVRRPAPPAVKRSAWVRNPIDSFILAKLEAKGIPPSPEADRVALLRRASFDLTGLPPTDAELEAFLSDQAPNAFEKAVDRLLASPRYGERWARHWLDLVRYADSDGFKADHTRPNVWRYRDYVIRSFNSDKPYDRFLREQIAGDELWPQDPDALVATGFHRHYPEEYNAQNLRQRRLEILNDITDTTSAVFLGLTMGCARCHDHKFDPILQDDYYKLQAFFANVSAMDDMPLLPAAGPAEYRRKLALWEQKTEGIRPRMDALLEPGRKKRHDARFIAYAPDVQAAVMKPAGERTPLERWMVHRAEPFLTIADESLDKTLKGTEKDEYAKLRAELDQFSALYPGELPVASVMTELGREAPPTSTLAVGLLEKPLRQVEPGFPSILDAPPRVGLVFGTTDEIGLRAVENRVHVHDLHATIMHLMGLDHLRVTHA